MVKEEEKIVQTFMDNALGRNELVFAMANQLNSISSNRVISLEGSWGTGKTFLLKQLKYLYDNVSDEKVNKKIQNEKLRTNFKIEGIIDTKIFYYDAWKNDDSKFPLLSLIYEIIKESGIDFGKGEIKVELNNDEIAHKIEKTIDKMFDDMSKKYPILSILNELRKIVLLDVQQSDIKDLLEKISIEKNKEQLIFDIFERIKKALKK